MRAAAESLNVVSHGYLESSWVNVVVVLFHKGRSGGQTVIAWNGTLDHIAAKMH